MIFLLQEVMMCEFTTVIFQGYSRLKKNPQQEGISHISISIRLYMIVWFCSAFASAVLTNMRPAMDRRSVQGVRHYIYSKFQSPDVESEAAGLALYVDDCVNKRIQGKKDRYGDWEIHWKVNSARCLMMIMMICALYVPVENFFARI